MADSNIQLPPDGAGKALDTRTQADGEHREVVVLGDPTASDVAPVDATAGLKVDLGADNDVTVTGLVAVTDGGGVLSVDDGGGSLTVDGTVGISGSVAVDDSTPVDVNVTTSSIPVTDNGGSLTVDGTVAVSNATFPVTDNGGSITVDDGGSSLTVDGTVSTTPNDQTVISTDNSTTTPLSGSGSWSGAAEDILAYSEVTLAMYATPSNATGTLYFEFSPDGTNWDVSIPTTVSDPTYVLPIPLRTVARYYRARYVNDGVAQTAFRLNTVLHRGAAKMLTRTAETPLIATEPVEVTKTILTGRSPDGTYTNVTADVGGALLTEDFLRSVARGDVPGYELVTKFGRNPETDTATDPEDVWNMGGLYTGFPVSTSETVNVVSDSVLDTSAGTGARTVVIVGLDASWNVQSETITMNGVVPVTSSGTYRRVNRAFVATAGSGAGNAGTITIRHTTTTTNVFGTIGLINGTALNQTLLALFTVPAGKTGWIMEYAANMAIASGAAGAATVSLRTRESGAVFRARRVHEITNALSVSVSLPGGLECSAQTDVIWRIDEVSDNNTKVTAQFLMLLVDD